MLTILSVDWDYYFPNTTPFDWQMNENNGLYYELVWQMHRGYGRNLFTGERALDVMHPSKSHETFWEDQISGKPNMTFIAESHGVLFDVLKAVGAKNSKIVNFDAHHDCGYGKKIGKERNCGNWGYFAKKKKFISEFIQVYPEWRKKDNDEAEPTVKPDQIVYSIPKQHYDMIFVCRSSCWTPPWADKQWLNFIKPLQTEFCQIISWPMNDKDWPIKARNFNMEAALESEKQMMEMQKQFLKENPNTKLV